ncbi:MAG: hypothetical protein ABIP85_22690 [Chthoniobacteraceae bacterium]
MPSSDLPPGVDRFSRRLHLKRIHEVRCHEDHEPNNSRLYRQWLAATACGEDLLQRAPRGHQCLITIPTSSRRPKKANKALSNILEKIVGPCCHSWVRFFHRTPNGFIHWHILAHLRFSVLEPGKSVPPPLEHTYRAMGMAGHEPKNDKELQDALAENSQLMQNRIIAALRRAKLGCRAQVAPVFAPDSVVKYLARYILGSAKIKRWILDRRLQLWRASKNAKIANADCMVLTQWTRIARFKNAAYCASRGWCSMAQARQANPRWQWDARSPLRDRKLRVYQYECDYAREWGTRWSPRASGVRIRSPHWHPDGSKRVQYQFDDRPTDPAELASLEAQWKQSWDVPEHVWLSPDC